MSTNQSGEKIVLLRVTGRNIKQSMGLGLFDIPEVTEGADF